jgi:hypothetical protein
MPRRRSLSPYPAAVSAQFVCPSKMGQYYARCHQPPSRGSVTQGVTSRDLAGRLTSFRAVACGISARHAPRKLPVSAVSSTARSETCWFCPNFSAPLSELRRRKLSQHFPPVSMAAGDTLRNTTPSTRECQKLGEIRAGRRRSARSSKLPKLNCLACSQHCAGDPLERVSASSSPGF